MGGSHRELGAHFCLERTQVCVDLGEVKPKGIKVDLGACPRSCAATLPCACSIVTATLN